MFGLIGCSASPPALAATFTNLILPGFHADPSICRVDDDDYLVTSTFEYFPGVPVYHSRDLVNWKQIGHVLTGDLSTEQLNPQQDAGFNFTGVDLGLFATGTGQRSSVPADFDWFEHQPLDQ